ncbi:MAG: nitrophenyl compound nitroreductase subunit ArsF family protein [Bacteroidota bacterium]
MKRIISVSILLIMSTAFYAFAGSFSSSSNGTSAVAPEKKIEVLYFHFTRRCMTCNNVERVSKEAVDTQFANQVKSGEITYNSVNLDEKNGEAIGAKYKIEGQTLIIISGDKRVDLTSMGFMYANNSPEKLKAEIKKAVESLLK